MTVLVTGGAGFIGSCFIRQIMGGHPDWRVVCADSLTYAGSLARLVEVLDSPRFRFCRLDICSREGIMELFREEHPDWVVNFAAESHVDRSIENPELFLHTNVLGTQVLLDACRTFGVRRFHQVSTDEVYGDLPLEPASLSFTEDSPLKPSSPYSASKASADLLALAAWRTFGTPVTVSRCSNNFGPWQHPEKLIPRMITRILQGKTLPVYGDGRNVRDWIAVEDHCAAVEAVLLRGQPGRVYNIGGDCQTGNLELVRTLCRLLGADEGCITFVKDRPGHDRRYALNTDRLRTELGWSPRIPFQEGLERTVSWYLEHRDWWEPLLGERDGGQ